MVHIVSVAEIGALVGVPARANMLEALMDRRALAITRAGEQGFRKAFGVELAG